MFKLAEKILNVIVREDKVSAGCSCRGGHKVCQSCVYRQVNGCYRWICRDIYAGHC